VKTKIDEKFTLKNNLVFEYKNIYNKLHGSSLMDKQLEFVRKAMKEKYDIDYVGIQMIDNTSGYILSNMNHDTWHTYIWLNNSLATCPVIERFVNLKSKENGLILFAELESSRDINIRADIIGDFKKGVEVMFSNGNNKILFSITFAKNKSITSLNFKTYNSLIKDLKSIETFLDPFMDYFKLTGNIDNSPQLESLINFNLQKNSTQG
jgi:hypothetical protein